MKKFSLRAILMLFFACATLVSCNLFNGSNSDPEPMAAADAKVEIRAANQKISDNMDAMLQANGFSELNYFMTIMTGGEELTLSTTKIFKEPFTYTKALNLFREDKNLKSLQLEDNGFYGIFEYDFELDGFVMVEESNSVLQFSYPADETAYTNQTNNCTLKIYDLEFDMIKSYTEEYNWETGEYENVETEEEIPVNANVTLTVDGTTQLSAEYHAEYTEDGLPTVMSISLTSDNYEFAMSFSGSATSYNTKLSQKLDGEEMMGYDLDVTYTSDMETVQKIEGYYLASPIKFEGSVNAFAIESASMNDTEPDLDYLNEQLDIEVIQVELNGIIGHLEYKFFEDEYGYNELSLVIVYEDGTYDLLSDVFTVMDMDVE